MSFANSIQAQGGTFCSQPYDFAVTNQKVSDIFPGGGSWPDGSTVFVTGTLTVDQTIFLAAIKFLMNTSAKIVVKGVGTSFIGFPAQPGTFTRFQGCFSGSMWEGIQVVGGATVRFNAVSLEDAYIGVHFLNSAHSTLSRIDNCTFEDNLTSIGILGFPSSNPFSFASFNNNRFQKGFGSLLPAPPAHPYSGTKPLQAIWISKSTVDLGEGANLRNWIEGCRYGIFCNRSNVRVINMSFRNSANDLALADTLDGTDIYATQSNLVVGGVVGVNNCTFFNAYNSGIISRNTHSLRVSNASFDSENKYGIRCTQSIALSAPINISDNAFIMNGINTVSAIYIERPPSGPEATNVLIKNNDISMTGGHQKGPIVLVDVQGKVEAADITMIDDNPILVTVTYPQTNGIRVTGKGHNYNVVNNDAMNWLPASNSPYNVSTIKSRGIIANDLKGFNHLISNNVITSKLIGEKSFLRAGIYLDNNPLSTFLCANNTQFTHKGIECLKSLNATTLKMNIIGAAAYGVYCAGGTVMPNQDRFENRWTGTYSNWGALYNGAPPFLFFFDASNTITDDAPPGGSWSPNFWFLPQQGSNATCGNIRDTLSTKEYDIIGGSLPDSSATDWDARRWLLYKLLNDSNLVASNAGAAGFLSASEAAATSPWKFAKAEFLFDQAWLSPSPAEKTQLSSLSTAYQLLVGEMTALEQQLAVSTGSSKDSIALLISAKYATLTAITEAMELHRDNAAPALQTALQNALVATLALPENTVFESNLKTILDIGLREAQGDSLVEADFVLLRAIAAQCPDLGGTSVRQAPIWMEHEEGVGYSDMDWDNNCGQQRAGNRSQLVMSPLGSVRVTPNPGNDLIRIECPQKTSNWAVRDITGRIIASSNSPGNTIELTTTQWLSGLYIFSAKTLDGETYMAKFSVMH